MESVSVADSFPSLKIPLDRPAMALTQSDRDLIEMCLDRVPAAWQKFVKRFLPLFVHAIRHTAQAHSYRLQGDDIDNISAEILAKVVENDFRILRNFRRRSSLATYLSVIARRVAVTEIARMRKEGAQQASQNGAVAETPDAGAEFEERFENREQVEYLVNSLSGQEADVVRSYHLDNKSYEQISKEYSIPINSIGPILTRAREYMKRLGSA